MSRLRYGIIGTGLMGIEHIGNVGAIDHATVTAIADPHRPSLDSALLALEGDGAEAADVAVFEDYRALLESDRCDVVVVASPNMTHIDVLRDVLATDLPVLVEKPLCTTIDDCRTVIELAADRDAIVWTGLEYRYMAPVARLIAEVERGATGSINMIAIREHRHPFLPKVGDWNRFRRNTGGTLVEKCCHFFDLMNLIAKSEPTRVIASGAQDVNHLDEYYGGERSDILDNAFVIVEYASGTRAMLDLCMFAEATHNQEEVSVVGDGGKVEALIPENVVRFGRRGEHCIGAVDLLPAESDPTGYLGHHHGSSYVEHLRFIDAVTNGTAAEVSLEDGLLAVAVGVAAHRSIDEGRPVALAEVLPDT